MSAFMADMADDPEIPQRPYPNRPRIAVIGGGDADRAALEAAESVGRLLALAGADLICGGLGGVMEAACRGAARAGGLTIGLLPGTDRRAGNRHLRCALPTGLGDLRNFLVVQCADGVIGLPGGSGTLSEAAMAATLGKPAATLGCRMAGLESFPTPEAAVRAVLAKIGK